jgi:hypothetical protein
VVGISSLASHILALRVVPTDGLPLGRADVRPPARPRVPPRGLHTGAKSEAELVTCEYPVRLVTCE